MDRILSMCLLRTKISFLCTQKVNTLSNRSVCPSGRLHDNFLTESPIVMKFYTQFCLIYISVEFEDEPQRSSISWFTAQNITFPP